MAVSHPRNLRDTLTRAASTLPHNVSIQDSMTKDSTKANPITET